MKELGKIKIAKEKVDFYNNINVNIFQVNFLKIVPLLSTLPSTLLSKVSDVLELEVYKKGDYIVREGTSGKKIITPFFTEYFSQVYQECLREVFFVAELGKIWFFWLKLFKTLMSKFYLSLKSLKIKMGLNCLGRFSDNYENVVLV